MRTPKKFTLSGLRATPALVLLLVLTPFALPPPCAAAAAFTHEVADDMPGRHVKWATPLAGGPLRALFVAPRFTLGDVSELATRLDMRAETVALWSAHHVGYDPMAYPELPPGGRAEDTLDRLDRLLRGRLDVIVLANFDTDILPEPVFSRILDKVADGMGLLLIQTRNGPDSPLHTVLNALAPLELPMPLIHGVAECAYPGSGPQDIIAHAYVHGQGRIVAVAYPGDPSLHHSLVRAPADPLDMHAAYADNAWSLVARALCAAAGRRQDVRIAEIRDIAPTGPDEDEIPPDFYPEFVQAMRDSVVAQPARPFEVVLSEEADQRYTLEAQLRRVDSDVRITYLDPAYMARGARTHRFEIPVGPGVYFLDAWLRTRSGVADWHTTEITVPGWPEFSNLTLDKSYLLPNDSLELSLDVRPVLNTARRATLYIRALDSFDRLVSDVAREVSHEGGAFSLRLHFSDLIAPLLKIEIYAVEGPARRFSEWELLTAFRDVRYIGVRRRRPPMTLDMVAVTTLPDAFAHLRYFRSLSELGVTTLHAPAGEASLIHAAREGLRLLPQLERFAVDAALEGVYREPCFNDPGYRARLEESLRDRTLRHWAGSWGRYSVGARNYICATDEHLCQCRHCLDRFHAALREDHPSLDALNRAWNADFGDWDFIELPAAMGPGHDGPVAPWVDFRRFMDVGFADLHRWSRAIIRNADPGGEVGALFGADTHPMRGCHWPALLGALDFAAIEYGPDTVDALRSFTGPGAWSGVALNGVAAFEDASALAWLPWHLLFNQLPALWFEDVFGDALSPTPHAWLLPDGRPTPALETITEAVRKARDTTAPLILAADADKARIAIYDSHASRHIYDADNDHGASYHDARTAAARLLRLSGYPYVFIDKTRLQSLTPADFKAILLPMAGALDADERHALLAYAAAGGALVADILPGVMDAHGMPLDNTPTASLFGVTTAAAPRVQRAVLNATDVATSARDLGWVEADAAITLEAGVALAQAGETPAWITNRYRQGHTLLLNYPFRDVVRDGQQRLVPGEFNAIIAFIRDLPGMPAPLLETETPFLGEARVYRHGGASVYGVLADFDAPRQAVRLPFNRRDHVYDILAGELLRRPHRTTLRLTAGEARVLTRLPYRVRELQLEAPEVAHAGDSLPIAIRVETDGDSAGKHLFLLDFMPRFGDAMPWYRQLITADAGTAATALPLALNEIPGRYTLRVRDLLTGLQTESIVAVSSPSE